MTKKQNTFLLFFNSVVMQPHTIINQTLHSYCKEQYEFNIQPMYLNLTEYKLIFLFYVIFYSYRWPSGFIYARNPYQKIGKHFSIIMKIIFSFILNQQVMMIQHGYQHKNVQWNYVHQLLHIYDLSSILSLITIKII